MLFQNLDQIVFAGDSVTDMGSASAVADGPGEALGQGYVRKIENYLAAFHPEINLRITNAGVSGNTSATLRARFETDVLATKPAYISIMIGVNDVWRQFDMPAVTSRHVLPDEYEKNMRYMIEASQAVAKEVIIMTPFYIEPNAKDTMRAMVDTYGAICRKLAKEYGCRFVDLQAMFNEYCQVRHSVSIAPDRVHPNQIGATLIARAFLEACEAL